MLLFCTYFLDTETKKLKMLLNEKTFDALPESCFHSPGSLSIFKYFIVGIMHM